MYAMTFTIIYDSKTEFADAATYTAKITQPPKKACDPKGFNFGQSRHFFKVFHQA